jgi:hypothetical protein
VCVAIGRICPRGTGERPPAPVASRCSRPRPRRRQGQSSHVRPQGCLCAPGTLGRRQRAIGVYFTLETVQERGTGRLGRLFGVTLGVEAVSSQAGAKGSLCRGQPPSVMHSSPSLLVATPPVVFRPPRTATRTQIRGAGFSYRWTRDERKRNRVIPRSCADRLTAPLTGTLTAELTDEIAGRFLRFGHPVVRLCAARQLTATLTGTLTAELTDEIAGRFLRFGHPVVRLCAARQLTATLTGTLTGTLTDPGHGPVSGRGSVGTTRVAASLPSSLTARRTATIASGVLWVKTHNDPKGRYGS